MMLFHGTPGEPAAWTRSLEADTIADNYASHHDGVAPILVMPDINGSFEGDTECVDGRKGKVETYLTQDVYNWARENLDPALEPQRWALGGYSEGGFCAMTLTMLHTDKFRTFMNLGGEIQATLSQNPLDYYRQEDLFRGADLFAGDRAQQRAQLERYIPRLIVQRTDVSMLAGWFGGGAQAPEAAEVVQAARLLCPHSVDIVLGFTHGQGHNFWAWKTAFVDAIPWLSSKLEIADFPIDDIPATAQSIEVPPAAASTCTLLHI